MLEGYSARERGGAQEMGAIRNVLQIKLALLAYTNAHPSAEGSTIRNLAMREWVGDPDDSHSLAAQFSHYIDEHLHELVDLDDAEGLRTLLEKVQRREEPTVH